MPLPPKNPPQPLPNNQTTPRATVPPAGMMPGRAPLQPNMRPGQPMRSGQPNMRPGQPNMRPGQPLQRPVQPQGMPPQNTQQSQQNSAAQSNQNVKNQPAQNFASEFNLPPSVVSTKGFLLITVIALLVGFFFGNMMGGNNAPAPQQTVGLRGVVSNKDITSKMPRCGLVEKGQACLLYIMNSTRYDKIAEKFFEEAAKLMGVQVYSIGLVNPKYAKELIKPGYIAEIKIPKL